MTFIFLGPDPLDVQIQHVLERLSAGETPRAIESAQVDVKEEPGRRDRSGALLPGSAQNDRAARYLAGEMACFANTPGGGAIIVGVADDGARTGTDLDEEWLRHRIWQLTEGRLTIGVRAAMIDGTRILVLLTHEAIEPIRHEGRLRWRVDDNCVDVDPTTWHASMRRRIGVDWSAQPSGHTLSDASPVAVELARRYLRAAGDDAALDLASATDADLLRRLNVVTADGHLTNAGSLLFVKTPSAGLDYIRRDLPGGDSTHRVRGAGPLLEQVFDADRASEASNRLVHLPEGFAHGQLRAIPARALREAIVNGVVHRDWLSPPPTTVEHTGDVLTVTSPGGFIGGVTPSNIITHPAVPRYRSLADAMATLRLAEREGIGVDRMVRDLLAMGRPEPEIAEIDGPYVRVALVGGDPDPEIIHLLSAVQPRTIASDLDALLIISHLTRRGWVDAATAQATLQRSRAETEAALTRASAARIDGSPLLVEVGGIPDGSPSAYRLSDAARPRLATRTRQLATGRGRSEMILGWARSRGRVSSTEVADLAGISVTHAGTVLASLAEEGLLTPGRERRRGRGFFYVEGPGARDGGGAT
ncbi:MAG: ATP-binding protein [Actinomycetota bacterium]